MAMTAWSAKVLRSSICRSVKRPASARRDGDRTDGDALAQHRHGQRRCGSRRSVRRPGSRSPGRRGRRECGRRRRSGSARAARSRGSGAWGRPHGAPSRQRDRVRDGRRSESSSPSNRRTAANSAPQSCTALSAIVSNTGWTSVGELGDDPQDLAGRGLLLEGLGEVVVAGLELREEADVLDGDDRLVGEGLQQLELPVGEWLGEPSGTGRSLRPVCPRGAGVSRPSRDAEASLQRTAFWELVLGLGGQVTDVHGVPVHHCATGHRPSRDRDFERRPCSRAARRSRP